MTRNERPAIQKSDRNGGLVKSREKRNRRADQTSYKHLFNETSLQNSPSRWSGATEILEPSAEATEYSSPHVGSEEVN